MKIQLLKHWGQYPAGRFLDTQPNIASLLIKRGMALEVPDKPKVDASTPRPRRRKQAA